MKGYYTDYDMNRIRLSVRLEVHLYRMLLRISGATETGRCYGVLPQDVPESSSGYFRNGLRAESPHRSHHPQQHRWSNFLSLHELNAVHIIAVVYG